MHYPGHVREAFLEWLDEFGSEVPPDTPRSREMLFSVFNCSDILPSAYCDQLDIRPGHTYDRAARDLLRWYDQQRKSGR